MVTSRHIYFLQCSSFGEVDVVDLETRFRFCFGCPHLGEADFVDLEVLFLFLQCVLLLVESILLTLRHDF